MDQSQSNTRPCCIICYRDCNCCEFYELKITTQSQNNGYCNGVPENHKTIVPKFFEMLQRYLQSERAYSQEESSKLFNLLFQILKTKPELLHSCNDCFGILTSFCDLYHDLERIKLLLNWILGTLSDIMTSARKVKSRVRNFKQSVEHSKMKQTSVTGTGINSDMVTRTETEIILSFKKSLEVLCKRMQINSRNMYNI